MDILLLALLTKIYVTYLFVLGLAVMWGLASLAIAAYDLMIDFVDRFRTRFEICWD